MDTCKGQFSICRNHGCNILVCWYNPINKIARKNPITKKCPTGTTESDGIKFHTKYDWKICTVVNGQNYNRYQ